MNITLVTLLVAFIIMIACLALLGIGWLLTGKSKMEAGACGRAPGQKRGEDCGAKESCALCKNNPRKDAEPSGKDEESETHTS